MTDVFDPTTLAPHLPWLHRWFTARGVDPVAADDLVQNTLVEAWRHQANRSGTDDLRPWLAAIARFILLRWHRESARAYQHTAPPPDHDDADPVDALTAPESADPAASLDHDELVRIVTAALDALPPATRALLLARYRDDLPVSAIATRDGVTTAHAGVRLQRARGRLREILLASFADDLSPFGVSLACPALRQTRLWCPKCGTQRLMMELDGPGAAFALTCPACNPGDDAYLYTWRLTGGCPDDNPLRSARTPAEALDRTVAISTWKLSQSGQQRRCDACQSPLVSVHRPLNGDPDDLENLQLCMRCPRCGDLDASATFGGMATFHPDGLAFWRSMGRIVTRPPVPVRVDQQDAVRVDLVALESSRILTYHYAADGDRLLGIITDA